MSPVSHPLPPIPFPVRISCSFSPTSPPYSLSAWKAFVDLHDGVGFRLCGTWDLEPPQTAVKTVVMDHILRIVMD